MTLMHRLHLDISTASHFFINGLTIRLRLIMNQNSYFMFNGTDTATPPKTEKTSLKITDASILFKTATVNPDLVLDNERRLGSGQNARWAIKRVDVRQFITPSSGKKISLSNVFLGPIPTFLAMTILDSSAETGNYSKNPHTFYHLSITQIAVHVNNSCLVLGPVNPDLPTGYVPMYYQLLNTLAYQGNDNPMISYNDFRSGYFVGAWDLSADLNGMSSSHISLSMTGALRIEIDLKDSLTTNYVVSVYAVFPGVIEVTKDRLVIVE